MRKYLVLTIVSLTLILAVVLAGIVLSPDAQDNSLNIDLFKNSSTTIAASIGTLSQAQPKLFKFGEPVGAAILLEMSASQTSQQEKLALTTAPTTELELLQHEDDLTSQAVCWDEIGGASMASPQSAVSSEELSRPASYWERLIAFMQLSFDRQYRVSLWDPAGRAEEYTLVIDDPQHPVEDSSPESPAVCEERT